MIFGVGDERITWRNSLSFAVSVIEAGYKAASIRGRPLVRGCFHVPE
jgi:hypothetical protein